MAQADLDLSIIVPAYNEAERIPKTLRRLREYFSGQSCSYEIIVVLDGPSDSTRDVLKSMSGEIEKLRCIDRRENHGKGFTVREGMLRAAGRVRLFTDADNSTDITHFDKMRPLFDNGYDIVIASRNAHDVPGAQEAVPQGWTKRMLGRIGNLFIQLVAVRGIWDTQCGFKAFRADAAERIFSQTKIPGWGFDIEVLALARAQNFKVGIIPAHWVNDDRSHVRSLDYLGVLADTVRVRYNLAAGKYKL
jgi:glycosyltransferase involved in cell wall biosynthesis